MSEIDKTLRKQQLGVVNTALGEVTSAIVGYRVSAEKAAILNSQARDLGFDATGARQAGQADARNIMINSSQLAGKQRVLLASRGINLTDDVYVEAIVQSAVVGRLDALTALDNAEKKARQLLRESDVRKARAQIERSSGQQQLISGAFGSVSTLLTGLSEAQQRAEDLRRGS